MSEKLPLFPEARRPGAGSRGCEIHFLTQGMCPKPFTQTRNQLFFSRTRIHSGFSACLFYLFITLFL